MSWTPPGDAGCILKTGMGTVSWILPAYAVCLLGGQQGLSSPFSGNVRSKLADGVLMFIAGHVASTRLAALGMLKAPVP